MVTLSRRFSAAFILIVAAPTLVISVVLARLYLSALYATVAGQDEATTEQVAQNIRSETDAVSFLASALVHDRELAGLADGYAQAADRAELYRLERRLDDKLTSFLSFSNRVGAVSLFLRGGKRYTTANVRTSGLIQPDLLAEALADPGKVFLLDTLGDLGNHSIAIAVAPPPEEPSALEAVLVHIRVPYFDALAAGPGGGEEGPDAMVIGRDGRPLLSSVPAASADLTAAVRRAAATPGHEVRAGDRAFLATVRLLDPTGWTIAVLSDTATLSRRVMRYQWYLYPALGLLALLFIAYAELFFARIAAPIRALIGHMGRMGKGDLEVRAAPQGIRELAELADGFNQMVDETRRLQEARERSERERLGAELEALRYQINPHFVANTLSSIRLMASAARADAIATMTRDLMRVLADSYSATPLTELARELETVAAYVAIMKVRFGERFDLELAPEPDVAPVLALRMLLQPLVENSILHGFAGSGAPGKPRRGTIRVGARLEARDLPPPPSPEPWAVPLPGRVLVIEVTDDGAGMSPARAAEVLTCPGERGGLSRIGLANVQRRIRLNFGEPYGLAVESEEGAYTRVRVLLPALLREPEPPEADRA
jgi:two-component system sensor histidine kinase YesM